MGEARVRVGGYDIYFCLLYFLYIVLIYIIVIILLYYTILQYYISFNQKMGLTCIRVGGYDQASSLEARFYAPVVSCYHIFAKIFLQEQNLE